MLRPTEYPFKVQIEEYVEWIFLNKNKLILYNLILLLLTVGVILFWPRQYRSEAKIWIKLGRENSHLDPTAATGETISICLLYTSPSPRDATLSRMPSSA